MPDSIPHGSHLHGVTEAAELLGMTRQGFKDAGQPKPDVWIGDTRGWTTETLREWDRTRNRRQKITAEKRARIVQMYRDGCSIAQTAKECGVSKASVIRIRATDRQ